jgi:hypothetical protein
VRWGATGPPAGVTTPTNQNANFLSLTGSGAALTFGVPNDGNDTWIRISGTVVNSTTSGTVQLQWAMSDVTGVESVTVRANSTLVAHKF